MGPWVDVCGQVPGHTGFLEIGGVTEVHPRWVGLRVFCEYMAKSGQINSSSKFTEETQVPCNSQNTRMCKDNFTLSLPPSPSPSSFRHNSILSSSPVSRCSVRTVPALLAHHSCTVSAGRRRREERAAPQGGIVPAEGPGPGSGG